MIKNKTAIIIISFIMLLLMFLATIIFSAWLIHIGHPGYLWLSVLFLLACRCTVNISDKEKDQGEGNDVEKRS
jgi:uncharacterized membrane protein YkvI